LGQSGSLAAAGGRAARSRSVKPVSLWGDARRRLLHNPVAVACLIVIAAFTLVAFLAPLIAPYDPLEYHLYDTDYPPAWQQNAPGGKSGDARFVLGTDSAGRDLFSRLLYGTRTSMLVGLIAAPLIAAVGITVGLAAGLAGPRVDNLLMRLTDVFYAFPNILFYILMTLILRDTAFGSWMGGVAMLIFALAMVSWVGAARLVRASVLSLKHEQFVEAARCTGVSRRRLLQHHLLPNCLGPIVVWIAFTIPRLIIAEAILGYLGIGLKPVYDASQAFGLTSWGGLFLDGRRAMSSRPWMMLAPAICLTLVAMAFNLLGDALRDALDPKSRQ
jgi:ABC-type dipeptide/oligopeptide/nickel transport system permease subunit